MKNRLHSFISGRYIKGNSLIHRIDARVKVFFLLLISIYLLNSINFLYPTIFFAVAIIISRINPIHIFKKILPILWLIAITFGLHFFIPPHNIEYGYIVAIRLLLLFGWATLLTATTEIKKLAIAITWYSYPLKLFGVSPENVGNLITLSLNFFPIIFEEADTIIKENKLKNGNEKFKKYKKKINFIKKLESFCSLFLIRILKRAENIDTDI